MAVQKNVFLYQIYQKSIFEKNLWKRKGYWPALKAFYLAKSLSTANSKSFFVQEIKSQTLE